jgi:hypothetical protein
MLKTLLPVCLITLPPCCVFPFGIVNNSGSSSEDSTAVVVFCTDSIGNPVSADSFFVLVSGPGGDSVFAETVTTGSPRIDSSVVGDIVLYQYRVLVEDIDGFGLPGTYHLTVTTQNTGLALRSVFQNSFQVVNWELDDLGDSVGFAATNTADLPDSLASFSAAFERIADSIAAMPDSLPIPGGEKELLAAVVADSIIVDSTHYQGSAPGVDSAHVASWVWNTPKSQHNVEGTFGDLLDASISGLSSGSGVYGVLLNVEDSSTSAPVPYASIAIRNLSQSALIAVGQADADGHAYFNLNEGSFAVIARCPGYTFAGCDTIDVAGADSITVAGYRFDPGLPASPSLCRVYGYLRRIDGSAVSDASVVAILPSGVARAYDLVISPTEVSVTTDSAGYFAFDLLPSASLEPAGTQYEMTITLPGGTILRRRLEVPSTPSWQLTW